MVEAKPCFGQARTSERKGRESPTLYGFPFARGKAIAFSRFEESRKQEEKDGFREKMPLAKSFFRKGEIGSSREVLTQEQAAKIVADHAEVMRRFG